MHRANVIMFGAGLLLAATAPAFAEGEGDTTGTTETTTEGGATAGATTEGGATAGATGETSTTATTDGGDTMGAWPQAIIDRPYVREKGKLAAYGDLNISHLSISIPGLGSASATGEALHVGAAYSVAPKLAIGADYFAPVAGDLYGDKGKGPLAIFLNYALVDSAKLHVAVNADFVADLSGDPVQKSINVGLGARYNLAPKIALFTGAPFGPGPVGQHLTLSLEEGNITTFDLPVGIGLQATPQLFAYVQPLLASFLLKKPDGYMGDSAAFYFSDALGAPTNIGAWFAVNKNIDAGVSITDDLKHAGDFYSVNLGARWYN